ncbi:MAG: hypothetical protein ACR2K1_14105, partial [Saprospiraceae bacterium]
DWSLDGEAKKKKKKSEEAAPARVRTCAACYAVFEMAISECPYCGVPVQVKSREVKQADGELRELTADDKVYFRRTQNKEVGRARTLADLERIAEQRGYKKGWAKYVFESRQKRAEFAASQG